jgi:hypothetical protein
MISTDASLAMVTHASTFDSAAADIDDPDQAELDRLTASLDDLDCLSRGREQAAYCSV